MTEEQEVLLAYAKANYPIGTIFIQRNCIPDKEQVVDMEPYFFGTYTDCIAGRSSQGVICWKGKFAEIISKPELIINNYLIY